MQTNITAAVTRQEVVIPFNSPLSRLIAVMRDLS